MRLHMSLRLLLGTAALPLCYRRLSEQSVNHEAKRTWAPIA
ncbi:hypothetical protein SNOG_08235 [Parastagonospora nodorum SN15]|uniref:Uncharacterized protein n=1 Tax=Phaeosphaeria nodorum (strain SN15 / ATCC MYA-4574 / FGSC 10173) TaxID=321614 RepID=Q0UJ29_PHANO|nr:hypothetical protein SNOG_08235 [Parastagonospora nodorum SN15]EAT84511.1 hypothetical protein SNOG_08235 [Parastagonospora nodorum SN15]